MEEENVSIIKAIAKALNVSVLYHVGDKNCKKCKGVGFIKTPWVVKIKAMLSGVQYRYIRKTMMCKKCKGKLIKESEV